MAQIKDGVSTKDDVKGLLGSPGVITTKKEAPNLSEDMEFWTYTAVTQTHAHALVFLFKSGIVKEHSKNVEAMKR